ncbi:MAG: hypothetical protein R2882_12850 [Gemmatimonadales bacterium]
MQPELDPRQRFARVLAMAVFAVLFACSPPPESLQLLDGRRVNDLLSPEAKEAVLLVSPAQCLSCDEAVSAWLRLRQRLPHRVKLVLTSEPTVEQQRLLSLQRVHPDGTLRASLLYREASNAVLLYDKGYLEALPVAGSRPALARLLAE